MKKTNQLKVGQACFTVGLNVGGGGRQSGLGWQYDMTLSDICCCLLFFCLHCTGLDWTGIVDCLMLATEYWLLSTAYI